MAGGVVTTAELVPTRWAKPVVDQVLLPAHAVSSPPVTTTMAPARSQCSPGSDSNPNTDPSGGGSGVLLTSLGHDSTKCDMRVVVPSPDNTQCFNLTVHQVAGGSQSKDIYVCPAANRFTDPNVVVVFNFGASTDTYALNYTGGSEIQRKAVGTNTYNPPSGPTVCSG